MEVVSDIPEGGFGSFTGHKHDGFHKCNRAFEGRIQIRNLEKFSPSDAKYRLHYYLGTLLYQAIHAGFCLYVCCYHTDCREQDVKDLGLDGHQRIWRQVATRIEDATDFLYRSRLLSVYSMSSRKLPFSE
jgi:hypothetical protein